MAEKEGFEPSCPFQDNPISSRGRYNHFDTSPYDVLCLPDGFVPGNTGCAPQDAYLLYRNAEMLSIARMKEPSALARFFLSCVE